MATDVSKRPQIVGDWKVKVIVGFFMFAVGMIGLANVLPLGWDLPTRWTASTLLVLVGLSVVMYGFADIT